MLTIGGCSLFTHSQEGSGTQRSQAPVAVWVRESSAEGYIEGEIIEWPMVRVLPTLQFEML
jgi:hypothetical protein